MAGLLQIETLRQHMLPATLTSPDRAAELAPFAPTGRSFDLCQGLVASWRVGHDGRLACRWTVGEPTIPAFPPD